MEDYRDYSLRERVFHKIQEDILKVIKRAKNFGN